MTCIGRTGSVTFREACRYAKNYTTGHESPNGLLEYPDNHIEVSPQIRKVIVHLARKYPEARWVHLWTLAQLAVRADVRRWTRDGTTLCL